MKIKIAVIAMISVFTSVKAQWDPNGNNSSTGKLTLDGSYININTPITTGGWARGINNMATDKSTRIGGIGLLGSGESTIKYYYMAHGVSPYSSGLGLYIKPNGNTGIGTVNPSEKLEVNGNITITGDLKMSGSDSYIWTNGTGTGYTGIWDQKNKRVLLYTSESTGNIGIGTTDTKGFKLGVNGKVTATEVKIATYANWSDFVFEKSYKLPSLENVEQHIKEKGHLKDIPSAEEVEKNGFYLGEMDAKLLQKIEELTLYTIQQEKKLKKQNSKINKQQKELEELKTLVKQLLKTKN
ncbi:hypothetical protein V1T75_00345 [Tenacibaculum sp. FZY0031]|uniref:hypothetical protein n=1 Tax=Tenacibaculum sp. FZY0031 TaxID=3116648 RepID=UPI002EA8BFCD|nr:hypothetical protein [Tenacibaculum sp. FZY0031]